MQDPTGLNLNVWPRSCQAPSTLRVWYLEGAVAFPSNGQASLDVPATWGKMGGLNRFRPARVVLTVISPSNSVLRSPLQALRA